MLRGIILGLSVVLCTGLVTRAEVVIETVTVGNPGNADDTHGGGYGGVDYVYSIGTFEVTAGQYAEFLNAVAREDIYALYAEYMDLDLYPNRSGCNIQRAGTSPNLSYWVAGDWTDRPVNYVSWGDAARFANWLHNGQPSGVQNLTTTEDGSYYLNGATTDGELTVVVRRPNATWVIPSEDEWYKAAYHKNDGTTGNYWDCPTSSDSLPSNDLIGPDPGNNATFYIHSRDYTIGSPYYRTEVGAHENSGSPYCTFDQGGNVLEWNEAVFNCSPHGSCRGLRGAWWGFYGYDLRAVTRVSGSPTYEQSGIGFRVAEVP